MTRKKKGRVNIEGLFFLTNHKQECALVVFHMYRFYRYIFYTSVFLDVSALLLLGFPCCRATCLLAEPLASLRGLSVCSYEENADEDTF